MRIEAVTLDAYGTLVRNEDLMAVPRRIVADHGLAASVDDVWRLWSELYFEATQAAPFRTLREIEVQILERVLRAFGATADPAPYVDLFFAVTTKVELYPEVPAALAALSALSATAVATVRSSPSRRPTPRSVGRGRGTARRRWGWRTR